MNPHSLSKSHIYALEQCPKRVWLQVHRADLVEIPPAISAEQAARRELKRVAQCQYPNAVTIDAGLDQATSLAATKEALASETPRVIFNAAFAHGGVFMRTDILEPDAHDGWHLVAVKSSTRCKSEHIVDVATQMAVLRANGVQVRSGSVRHLDSKFVLERAGDFEGLFQTSFAVDALASINSDRLALVEAASDVLAGDMPEVSIGGHCETPYACEFQSVCGTGLPKREWPIGLLPNTGKTLAVEWAEKSVYELKDLPAGALRNPLHVRVHEATLSGVAYHDIAGARRDTEHWAYPRTWLDFETIAFALPRWLRTRPYEQAPFQFSAHVEDADRHVDHREFLDLTGDDPRRPCAEALVALVPATGAVIAYNAAFERTCLSRLAELFPDLATPLGSIVSRLVDLLPVTKANWYHRDQRGSWSIKYVLPTIAPELDYQSLDVKDGMAAQVAYLEAIKPETLPERKGEIDLALRKYCGQDTGAMLVVYNHLTADH